VHAIGDYEGIVCPDMQRFGDFWPEVPETRETVRSARRSRKPTKVDIPRQTEEDAVMYVRVVRFTDVSAERMQELLARIEESDGPPPGVPAKGLKVLFDDSQDTAVVLQYFESAEDMEAGAQVFSAMDPSETPGARASVDMCEVKLERTLA
jgi:hypothetical protein